MEQVWNYGISGTAYWKESTQWSPVDLSGVAIVIWNTVILNQNQGELSTLFATIYILDSNIVTDNGS